MSVPTVGDLRKLLDALPDTAPILPDWLDPSVIDDACPSVTLCGFEAQVEAAVPYLSVKVDLCHPDVDEDDDDADK